MLQLLPLEEADLHAYQTVFAEAFKDDLMRVMYPNGYSEEDKQFGIDFNLSQWRGHPERVQLMKIIDTELPDDDPNGKIVAGAKWQFFTQDRSEAELQEEERQRDDRTFPSGLDVAFFKHFVETILRCKRELIGGKAHAMLLALFTRPSHHRRGIGAMHLDYGLRKADELGLQTYIEGSAAGKPLYERYGFKEVMPLPLSSDVSYFCMIRPARTPRGESDEPHT